MKTKRDRPGFSRRMSREEINDLPIKKFDGPIRLVRTQEELAAAMDELAAEKVLGFDTETRPARKKGQHFAPAVLQLAGSRAVYLFQLRLVKLPRPLKQILADPGIIKAGVAIDHDLDELARLTPFKPASFVDLAGAARRAGLKNHGLRGLAAVILGFRVSKTAQQSNWARDTLTPAQIRYAATDAWVGRELFLTMAREALL